jgi:predicted ATPase
MAAMQTARADEELARIQLAVGDRYRVVRRLGAGGMCVVYLAEDVRHGRDIAIKILDPELASAIGPQRFRREIEIAARLNHPRIVGLIDSGEGDRLLYYVMPFVAGDTLRAMLSREKQLAISDALRIAEQVASALDYAHRQGVLHRDIKPENILLQEGEALVADFGIALLTQSSDGPRLTDTGISVGTPEYMSPEQATGERALDVRCDVYSLACVLYEMLVGEPPYTGASARAVIMKSLSDPVPSARRLRDTIPPSVDEAIERALAKVPSDRFASVADFIAALHAAQPRETPSNLPSQANPFVGRERELREVGSLVRAHRLVTLTGPGGSGKTRLSLQVARAARNEFPDGTWWVPLQAVRDPALVDAAIKTSLQADGDLATAIGGRRLLIVLDNFEQVIEAATFVGALLTRTPKATILVTSREPLQLDAERRYPVDPLPDVDATALFEDRARAVAPGYTPTESVKEICRRLDGLPLAIELAAARVALLDPDDLLARLDRRLPLLATQSRDAPARQRTLRSAIEWSYELLTPAERDLFRRLAVFSGSFTLQAAESICDADVDTLESLVVKSLVRRASGGRFTMLETIREYAHERMLELADAAAYQRRHAIHYLALAQEAELDASKSFSRGNRLDLALSEQHNLRTALRWSIDSGAVDIAVDLAGALEMFWVTQNPLEGVRWFSQIFAHPGIENADLSSRAHALRAFGSATDVSGQDAPAEKLYQRSLELFDALGDRHGRAVLLHRLGIQAMRRGDLAKARQLINESDAIHESNGDAWGKAQTVGTRGAIARDAGDRASAEAHLWRSVQHARDADKFQWWEGGMLSEIAMLCMHGGRFDEAEQHARRALELANANHDWGGRVFNVGILATTAAARDDADRAGRLWGAIEHELPGAPLGGWRRHRADCEQLIMARADAAFESAREAGRRMTLDDAVAVALSAR